MSTMTDLLLGAGGRIKERPKGAFEVSRLSKLTGQPFLIEANALTMREMDACAGREDYKEHVILKAVIEPDFKDQRLAATVQPEGRKTALTPIEVIRAVLLPGEIVNLYNGIAGLSGFGDDTVRRIEKN